ncbi:MAG: hypothetical protein AAFY59_04795 [Pseudomonadota bacterium]
MVLVVLLSGILTVSPPQPALEVSDPLPPSQAQAPAPPVRKIDCYCTDKTGDRRELGELVCLDVDGRLFLARCEMSLNNPMWREVADGCVSASLDHEAFDRG